MDVFTRRPNPATHVSPHLNQCLQLPTLIHCLVLMLLILLTWILLLHFAKKNNLLLCILFLILFLMITLTLFVTSLHCSCVPSPYVYLITKFWCIWPRSMPWMRKWMACFTANLVNVATSPRLDVVGCSLVFTVKYRLEGTVNRYNPH